MGVLSTPLRSQLRTNVPGDIRISGRVNFNGAGIGVQGKGFTFVQSGTAGIYYVFFGAGVTATFTAGAIDTVQNSSSVTKLVSWNLDPVIQDPATAANVRVVYGWPARVLPGQPIIGLQVKFINSAGALAAPVTADGFVFELICQTTEVEV